MVLIKDLAVCDQFTPPLQLRRSDALARTGVSGDTLVRPGSP